MKDIRIRSHYNANQCAAPALPAINFAENRALLIALGDKSSAGYGIKLTGDRAEIHDSKLMLPVEIITPEKGQMQAQVITSPCMIVSFTKGDYTQIIVNEALGLALRLALGLALER